MKNNRRIFIKNVGMAGLCIVGANIVPSCRQKSDVSNKKNGEINKSNQNLPAKNWRKDPEWREVKYGSWSGPGVPDGEGPMDNILLKDYAPRSSVVSKVNVIPKGMFPAIDVHVHHYYPEGMEGKNPKQALADWVQTQNEVGIKKSVVLTRATGAEFDRIVDRFLKPYPEQFQLYCGVLKENIDESDYPQRAVEELERCYRKGARGVGEVTDKGFGITRDSSLSPAKRLHHTDARLEPFWNKCAELNLPVNIHVADHPSSWQSPDVYQERTPIFQQFNQYGGNGLSYEELQQNFIHLLKKHPKTTFIACHLLNLGNDLERLGNILDQHKNLYLDISARDYEIGRQPRSTAKFLTEYPSRVLFGTDMGMDKEMYQSWWRLLESSDEHMIGRVWWRYYGLNLPPNLLKKLYYQNAMKILNFTEV